MSGNKSFNKLVENGFCNLTLCDFLGTYDDEKKLEDVMHHVASLAVEGFWGTHDFSVSFQRDVTFFIGQNGTGKTTLVNLLAAALTADFRTLERIPFRKCTITLDANSKIEPPKIVVSKTPKENRPFELIEYNIRGGSHGKGMKFSLGDIDERLFSHRMYSDSRYVQERYRLLSSGLTKELQKLIEISWLSIQRGHFAERSREDRLYESTIDQKIDNQSNDLIRYFSTLAVSRENEVRNFQEYFFTSMLDPPPRDDELTNFPSFDVDEYRTTLENILVELHISKETARNLVSSYLSRAVELQNRHKASRKKYSFSEGITLYTQRRLTDVVDRWNSLQTRLAKISRIRDNWIRVSNELFNRKELRLTTSNEIFFLTRSGKQLTPQVLSSGEKHLLILLTEALLQKESKTIYIADEPELSLHVTWQEKLVRSLHSVNPHTQIVFATHSPDVVGRLADHAIDMESVIP